MHPLNTESFGVDAPKRRFFMGIGMVVQLNPQAALGGGDGSNE